MCVSCLCLCVYSSPGLPLLKSTDNMGILAFFSAAILFLFLITYFLIHYTLLHKLTARPAMFNFEILSATQLNLGWNQVVQPSDWEELGVRRHRQAQSEEPVDCAVCLCKIEEGEEVRELRCDHLFHRVCLDRWVGHSNMTCPLCRGSLSPPRRAGELQEDVLSFKFCSFGPRERHLWWLR